VTSSETVAQMIAFTLTLVGPITEFQRRMFQFRSPLDVLDLDGFSVADGAFPQRRRGWTALSSVSPSSYLGRQCRSEDLFNRKMVGLKCAAGPRGQVLDWGSFRTV
jgi:hypothetical protein